MISEGLNLAQTREYKHSSARRELAADRDTSVSDHAFGGSKSRKRITLPLLPPSSKHKEAISRAVKKAGFSLHDYHAGLAKDKHGREVRIGKILAKAGKHKELAKFNSDPARAQAQEHGKLQVVISRHPADIIGQSANCPWKSCMAPGHENHSYTYRDVRHGTHVAYLTRKGDHKARNPLARISLKPHHSMNDLDSNGRFIRPSSRHVILAPESSTYGNAPSEFSSTVDKWSKDNFKPKHFEYQKHSALYQDDAMYTRRFALPHHRKAIVASGGGELTGDHIHGLNLSKSHSAKLLRNARRGDIKHAVIRDGNVSSKVLVNAVRRGQLAYDRKEKGIMPKGRLSNDIKYEYAMAALHNNAGKYNSQTVPKHVKLGLTHPGTSHEAIVAAPHSKQGEMYIKYQHKGDHRERQLAARALVNRLRGGTDAVYSAAVKLKSTPVVFKASPLVYDEKNVRHAAKVGLQGSANHLAMAVHSTNFKTSDTTKGAVLRAVLKSKVDPETKAAHFAHLAGSMTGDKNILKLARHLKVSRSGDRVANKHAIEDLVPSLARRIRTHETAEALSRANRHNPEVQAVLARELHPDINGGSLLRKIRVRMLKGVSKDLRSQRRKDYQYHHDVDSQIVNMHYGEIEDRDVLKKHPSVHKHWLRKFGVKEPTK